MSKGESGHRIPLTYDDRLRIEQGLNRGDAIGMIARTISRTPTTVRDEIKRNWTDNPVGIMTIKNRNICSKKYKCDRTGLCKTTCARNCWKCKDWKCNSLCPDFEALTCPKLSRAPYCCNGCTERMGYGCDYPYQFYQAKWADDLAKCRRRESREGIDMSPEDFERSINAIKEGLKKGQSPAHIIASDERVTVSKSTFYRLVEGGAGNITKLDLPRAVRYRPRKHETQSNQIPKGYVVGRTYADFLTLPVSKQENAVEMDTVVGRLGKDKQCILTLYFRRLHFQFYILLENHSSECVIKALDDLQSLAGGLFPKLFAVILTDRGSEFADVYGMEHGKDKSKRTSIYFCDPLQSQQKAGCERNHEELRRILPKGKTDFDALTRQDMARCMSHINSYKRGSIDWFAPIDMAKAVFPPDLLDGLGIEKIEPRKVNLTPNLVPHAIIITQRAKH